MLDALIENNKQNGIKTPHKLTKTQYQLADLDFWKKMMAIDPEMGVTFINKRIEELSEQRDHVVNEIKALKEVLGHKDHEAIDQYIRTSKAGKTWGGSNLVCAILRNNIGKHFTTIDMFKELQKEGHSLDKTQISMIFYNLSREGKIIKVKRGEYVMET